jgi:hypothetical protein
VQLDPDPAAPDHGRDVQVLRDGCDMAGWVRTVCVLRNEAERDELAHG